MIIFQQSRLFGGWLLCRIRSSHPGVFLRKGVLKIWSKFTGEHQWQSVISIKLQSHFIEIEFRHGCFPVNLLHIFRTPFLNNTSEGLLLSDLDPGIHPHKKETLAQVFSYELANFQEHLFYRTPTADCFRILFYNAYDTTHSKLRWHINFFGRLRAVA